MKIRMPVLPARGPVKTKDRRIVGQDFLDSILANYAMQKTKAVVVKTEDAAHSQAGNPPALGVVDALSVEGDFIVALVTATRGYEQILADIATAGGAFANRSITADKVDGVWQLESISLLGGAIPALDLPSATIAAALRPVFQENRICFSVNLDTSNDAAAIAYLRQRGFQVDAENIRLAHASMSADEVAAFTPKQPVAETDPKCLAVKTTAEELGLDWNTPGGFNRAMGHAAARYPSLFR